MSIARYKVGPRIAAAAKHGDTIYVAGTVADDSKLDAKGQTAQILQQDRRGAGALRQQQVEDRVGERLGVRHPPLRRHERRLGRVARQGERAGPGDRRGAAGDAGLPGRDRGHRGRLTRPTHRGRPSMGSTTDRVSGRARAVPVSLIRRMFDLTPRVPGAISLAVGEPGFATPPHIVEAACQALHDGFTKYSPNPGYLDLREAIAEKIERVNGYQADPGSEIFVTVGAMQALALTFMVGIDPGDEVLVTDPSYTNFEATVTLAGGRVVFVPTDPEPRLPSARRGPGGGDHPAHARDPRQQPGESDGRRVSAGPPARDRGDLRAPRPPADLGRDVRPAHLRRHPGGQPGVVPRPPRPHGVDLLLLQGVRDDRLAHRVPDRAGLHAAGDGAGPGGDGLLRQLRDPAGRARRAPRAAGLRRDDAAGLPAAPRPGRRAARADPRGPLPETGRRLLRVPRRARDHPTTRCASPSGSSSITRWSCRPARRSGPSPAASSGSRTRPRTRTWPRA